jgi:pyruvate/2-oxoglutarate dehydrogenase complex dihydrolipoamide dehydrogenase (E3) component
VPLLPVYPEQGADRPGWCAGGRSSGAGAAGTSKLVVDAGRQLLVGATFTGPGMQELLHSATIAIVGELPLAALWQAVPPVPHLG